MTLKTTATLTALALSATVAQADIVFDADFEGATPGIATDAASFVALFNSGTAIGTWSEAGGSYSDPHKPTIITDGFGNNGAIVGGNSTDRSAHLSSNATLASGVSVSMSTTTLRGHGNDTQNRNTAVIGLDSLGNEVFYLMVEGVNNANKLTYLATGETDLDTAVYLGDINRSTGGADASITYTPGDMIGFELVLGATSFDIYYDGGGSPVASSLAYRTNGVTDLAEIQFLATEGNARAIFDDILVEVVPEPGSLALLGVGTMLVARRRRHSSV